MPINTASIDPKPDAADVCHRSVLSGFCVREDVKKMSPHLATAAIMLTLSVMTSSCTEFNQGRKVILGATGRPSRVVNPLPRYHSDLPSQWLWNDIRGVNYLTQVSVQ